MTIFTKKRAEACIAKMKEFGTLEDHKIGQVRNDFPETFPTYSKGEYVIVRDQGDGRYTVEKPLSLEDINAGKTGLLTTMGTMLNVPARFIKLTFF